MKSSRGRTIFIAIAVLTIMMVGLGYVLAFEEQATCVADTRGEVNLKTIKIPTIDGAYFTNSDVKYESKVVYPFQVIVSYELPWSIHSSRHENKYLVLPWQTIKQKVDPIYHL